MNTSGHFRYEAIARKYLSVSSSSGEELLCLCPFHNETNPSFRFNVRKGVYCCYSCGAKGGIAKFMKHFGENFVEPPVSLEVMNLQVAFLDMMIRNPPTKIQKYFPEASLIRYSFTHEAWARRGYNSATVARWGLGYDPVSDRLSVPLRDLYGRLLGVAFRRLDKTKHGKYIYPRNFPKTRNMFGSWVQLRNGRPGRVALMEGPTDVIKADVAGVPALGIYGSYFTEHHVELLHRLNIRTAVAFYDNDTSGRKALASTKQILDGIELRSVNWTGKPEGLDPGKLAPRIIRMMFDEA